MTVATLVLDQDLLLRLRLLQFLVDRQIAEARGLRPACERALLERLLARQQVLDPGLPIPIWQSFSAVSPRFR